MLALCFDTATSPSSIALVTGEKVLAESLFPSQGRLSARLLPEMEKILQQCGISIEDVDFFACSKGPGSFTGVRCGAAAVQGLAIATGKPCYGFSTLAMLAAGVSRCDHAVCPMLDARKNEVYGALYRCKGLPELLLPDSVMKPEPFLQRVRQVADGKVVFTGEGALKYRSLIESEMGERADFAPVSHMTGRASWGAGIAFETHSGGMKGRPAELLPLYIRPSEAEFSKKPLSV